MHSELKKFLILGGAVLLIAGGLLAWRFGLVPEIGKFFAAGSGTLTWHLDNSTGTPLWIAKTLPEDSVITNIVIDVSTIPKGGGGDVCVFISRTDAPTYPAIIAGYSEVMCGHADRGLHGSAGPYQFKANLAAMPYFLPKNTQITCHAGPFSASPVTIDCNLSYQTYIPGTPRYRTMRLPYNDQVVDIVSGSGVLAESRYVSSPLFPIHVKGFHTFMGLGDAYMGTATPCLQRKNAAGGVVQQHCFTTGAGPNQNYNSPEFVNLDWNIPPGDTLTATCNATNLGTDCALYVLVEIPPTIAVNPENTIRDYNNVPHPFIENWCTKYAWRLANANYCSPSPTCSDQTKINLCVSLFSPASCISTNSCSTTLTPTPIPTAISVPPPQVTLNAIPTTLNNQTLGTLSGTATDAIGVTKVKVVIRYNPSVGGGCTADSRDWNGTAWVTGCQEINAIIPAMTPGTSVTWSVSNTPPLAQMMPGPYRIFAAAYRSEAPLVWSTWSTFIDTTYQAGSIPTPTTPPTPPPTPVPGDADGDGHVNILDYNMVISHFGESGTNTPGDVNHDAAVNILDFNIVISHFGQ